MLNCRQSQTPSDRGTESHGSFWDGRVAEASIRLLDGLKFAQYHLELLVYFLTCLSTYLRPKTRQSLKNGGSPHLMMRGLNHKAFLGQWGIPEIKISINDLESFFILDFLRTNIDIPQNVAAWIYERKDMVLFFKREKLISHFQWSRFKKRFRRPHQRGFSSHGTCVESGTLRGEKKPYNSEGGLAFG